MEKIKIDENGKILGKNFYIKKIKNLAVVGKKQMPVFIQDSSNNWIPSGANAPIYDGQKTHKFRVVGNKLEFHFIGSPIEYLHSCSCERAYKFDNRIILPQGYGDGYVVITL